MARKFTTPRSEIQTTKLLAEQARALDPETAQLYDETLMVARGVVKTLLEHLTNPRMSMLWRAKIAIGRFLLPSETEDSQPFDSLDAEQAWNQMMGH